MASRIGGSVHYGQAASSINIQKESRGSLLDGAIQLNDRQLKILESRKANKTHRTQQQQTTVSPKKLPWHGASDQATLDTKNVKAVLAHAGSKTVDSRTTTSSSGAEGEYWAQEPTNTVETLPTTWSESASSAAGSSTSSSSDSFGHAAKQFYGQRLYGKEKKLYDDTGATWNDSRSQASASTSAMSKPSSNAPNDSVSRASKAELPRNVSKSLSSESPRPSRHESKEHFEAIKQNNSLGAKTEATSETQRMHLADTASLAASSLYGETKSVRQQDSATHRSESESEEESLMPLHSRSESLADAESHHRPPLSPIPMQREVMTPQSKSWPPRFQNKEKKTSKSFSERLRTKFFKNRDAKTTVEAGNDLMRNLIKNSPIVPSSETRPTASPKHVPGVENTDETASGVSSKSSETGSKKRFSMMKALRSPRSASSGSSITQEEKMIMKRFASKAGKNPRREKLIKSSSSKFPQELSPKESGPDRDEKAAETMNELSKLHHNTEKGEESQEAKSAETIDRFDPSVLPNSPYRATTASSGRGRRSSVRMQMVTSRVMNDLMEENVIYESDEEEDDVDDQPSLHHARSIRSLPDIVKDDEIEIKISQSTEVGDENEGLQERPDTFSPTSLAPSNVAYATQRALDQIHNEEPEGYSEFVSQLKCELSSSHTKLFDQFHAMVRSDGSDPKPLSMYPGGLDLKTKETITTMSSHAKHSMGVDCMTGSQMASDKDLEKMKPGKVQYGQQLLKPTKGGVLVTQPHRLQPAGLPPNIDETDVDSIVGSAVSGSPTATSSESISAGSQGMAYEVTLSQHVRKSIAPSPSAAPESSRNVLQKNGSIETRHQGSADSIASSNDSLFDGIKSVAGSSMVSKSISPKMYVPPLEKETIPWTHLKLRAVVSEAGQDSSDTEIPAAWAQVKLRKVKGDGTKDNAIDTSIDSSEAIGLHRIELRRTPTNSLTPQNNLALALAPSASTDVSGTVSKPINIERNGENAKQPIMLAETRGTGERPIKIEESGSGSERNPIELANETSVMISLADESSGGETKLLLSKKGILKVEAIPGEAKADVLWRLDRKEVKSALMNMSALTVKLIVSSGEQHHKDLTFPSAEQCKRFANALHDLLHGSKDDFDDGGMMDEDHSKNSVYVEQLNADEQKVLEEFRHRKKTTNNPQANFAKEFLKISAGSVLNKPPSIVNASSFGPSSPLSEVSGVHSLLSIKPHDSSLEQYRKMLHMKVPREAVRHKMIKDQIDSNLIDSLLAEGSKADNQKGDNSRISAEESKIVTSYRRMLKMGVPAEGVRHKMQKEGVSSQVMAAVLDHEQIGVSEPQDGGLGLSIVEEAVAETYRKMLKMMIPKEAVQHRMIKDGVDPKIMAVVIGKPPEQPKRSEIGKSSTDGKLSESEESIASDYRKMLKLSIPKDAVRHKMTQEGISEKIMTAVLGLNLSNGSGQRTQQKRGLKPGFHWNPIADDESIAGSVWSKAKPMSDAGTQKPEDIIDITKHVEMFQKQPDALSAKTKTQKAGSDSKEMAKLIDLNRANNVAITLKAFNDYSHSELARTIEFLDPEGKIKGDRALFMKDLLPTSAEVKSIKNYRGGDEKLVTAEKWFKQIVHIKRIDEKIEVMRTIETFKMDAVVLGKSFQLLHKVCNQVMDSDRLPGLLDMVRQIGNTMNEGRGDAAAGFKLDFLPRLAQTKGSDKKTTALDLVVMLFHVRNQREALMLSTEIPDCQEASRIQLSDLMTDVRSLEGALRKCKRELDHLKKERDSSQNGKPPSPRGPVPTDSRSDADLNQMLKGHSPSVLQDIKSDIEGSTRHSFHERSGAISATTGMSPRTSLLASLQEKNGIEFEFSLDASIRRLEKFVSESSYVILPRLEAEREEAVESCRDLASFFCESGGEKTASNLLKILDEFASGIDRAVVKYDQQQKVEARKKATQKRKSLTNSKPPAPELRSSAAPSLTSSVNGPPFPETKTKVASQDAHEDGEKKSLVLMVNEMLKMAGDKQVKDFMKGVVYDNPDTRMKKIYEAEKSRNQDPFAARREIVSAIEAKRNSMDTKDTEEATLALVDLKSSLESDRTVLNLAHASRVEAEDTLSEMPTTSNLRRKSRIADRWTKKIDGDDCVDANSENADSFSKTDSEILSSASEDVEDRKYRRKKRQSYMERWASREPVAEASSNDLEAESDVGAFEEMLNKQRQRAIDRWSRKRDDDEFVE